MGRPKGSKNKPKFIMAYGDKNKGTINSNPKKNLKRGYKIEDADVEKVESVEKVGTIEKVEPTPTKSTEPTEPIVDEIKEVVNNSTGLQSTPKESAIPLKELKDKINLITKPNKNYLKCERCSKEIYCEPRRIDTNILTGMADFHRSTPRYIKLCDDCCRELNKIVNDWLLSGSNNEELKKKGW